ncbi:MAG: hypothetical protein DI538_11315 [Azospira oryzae]|nr:MAG: hypothetical protein DI538_11315 [Azospira oryzae]
MLAKRNSEDEEEDEEDLSLICSVNGTNQKDFERIKLASKISAAEEEVLTKQLEVPAVRLSHISGMLSFRFYVQQQINWINLFGELLKLTMIMKNMLTIF